MIRCTKPLREFTLSSIALVVRVVFNVLPHETDVSARAIKEF